MRKITCVIADDEELAREILENYIGKLQQLEFVATCASGTEVYNVLKKEPVDLLFLDIRMPQLSGLEVLRIIKDPPPVILTTAFREYALEGYELPASAFMRVHRSYILSLGQIESYTAAQVWVGKAVIPIGKSYAKEVLKRLQGEGHP